MTFSLRGFKAYGIRCSGATRQQTQQVAEFSIVAANTDTALDIASDTTGSLGTFWTAAIADATYGGVGTGALAAIQSIQNVVTDLKEPQSEALSTKTKVSSGIMTFLSAASVGGSATEAYTVTGLLSTDTILSVVPVVASATGRATIINLSGTVASGSATPTITVAGLVTSGNGDTILAVTQTTKGANSLPLLGWSSQAAGQITGSYSADPGANAVVNVCVKRVATVDTYTPVSYGTQVADGLSVTYGADPGAGAKVRVTVYRPASAVPVSGEYGYAVTSHMPSITFASGNAPTAQKLRLIWTLQDNTEAVVADYGTAF